MQQVLELVREHNFQMEVSDLDIAGLAICKKLVELLKGTIQATSVEGEGTTFHFSVAFRQASKPEQKALMLENAKVQPDSYDDKLCFLLVEGSETGWTLIFIVLTCRIIDNAFNVRVIKNFFRNDENITCDVAINGKVCACTNAQTIF